MIRHAGWLYHVGVVVLCLAILAGTIVPDNVAAESASNIEWSPSSANLLNETQSDESTLESPSRGIQKSDDQFNPSAVWEALPWQQAEAANPFQPLLSNANSVIQITDAGFSPSTLNLFGPSDVTWINLTAVTQTVRSSVPQVTPTSTPTNTPIPPTNTPVPGTTPTRAVYLPVISSQRTASEQQTNAVDPGAQSSPFDDTLIAILPPGAAYTRRFIDPIQLSFYLEGAPQFSGSLALTGVGLLESSPASGENDVAVTRETILDFSGALDAASLSSEVISATFSSQRLTARLQLSPDKRKVTLFYNNPLPSNARVRVHIDGSKLKDSTGALVDTDGDGQPGGRATLEFDTLTLTVLPGTSVCGRVFASELEVVSNGVSSNGVSVNNPLQGATITVDGQESILRTTTDAQGNFCLNPAPAGRFFVHIDGRTASNNVPAGGYYPFVGKAWESIPGQQSNVGDVFLPLVPAGTMQDVSSSQDTEIHFAPSVLAEFPNFADVKITVPADSLYSDNGTRGGKVGIAPVPPDRLPGQLPPGLNFPVVITVQTDGATNFDRPVPACFPNLPNPTSGQPLPANSKSALWSFNHDTGRFEVMGAMTVSADGKLVCTDAGVGIEAPGWHSTEPGVNGDGGEPEPPEPEPCNPATRECKPKAGWNPNEHFNGCGPDGADYLVPDNPTLACSFFEACKAHDIGYSTCNASKQGVDDQFLSGMLAACNSCYGDLNPDRLRCIGFAELYHAAVSRGGESAFGDAQGEACDCKCAVDVNSSDVNSTELRSAESGVFPLLELNQMELNQSVFAESRYSYAIVNRQNQFTLRGSLPAGTRGFNQLILAPSTQYQIILLQEKTLNEGVLDIFTPDSGFRFKIPTITIKSPLGWDLDNDGLAEGGEYVMGTDIWKADSDGDGIGDGAEVQNGTDPLDGQPARTGIIGTAETPGTAADLCTMGELIAVADSFAGVAIFNGFNGMNPILIAQVDTPGNASAVACTDDRVLVADGSEGLAVIDSSDPASARIVRRVALGNVTEIAATSEFAYVASGGELVLVDILTGEILDRQSLSGGTIDDVSIANDFVYVLTVTRPSPHTIRKFALGATIDEPLATLSVTELSISAARMHLFAADGLLYVGSAGENGPGRNPGIEIIQDDGVNLRIVGPPSGIIAFDVEANGTGLALFTGADVGLTPSARFALLDVTDPSKTDRFLTSIDTPGAASAIALQNGFAFVADSQSGLQVINYISYDNKGISPTITLNSNFATGVAEEDRSMRLTAVISEDVQIRAVEFYVDAQLLATDGNFPFETRFTTPLQTSQSSFVVRAKAIDTGGNFAWTNPVTYTLVADATPARIVSVTPQADTWSPPGTLQSIVVNFNEAMAPTLITPSTFRLVNMGQDKPFGTNDDQPIAGTVSYEETSKSARLTLPNALPEGSYRALIQATDIAGNPLRNGEFGWNFSVGVITWDGGGDNQSWHDPANWSNDRLPDDSRLVVINSAASTPIIYSQNQTRLASLQSNRSIQLSGGKLSLNSDSVFAANLDLAGGELGGSGTVTVTGTLTWTAGTMSGIGKTVSTGNLVLGKSSGFPQLFLSERRLENVGIARQLESQVFVYNNGVFVNQVGASFTDQSNTSGGFYLNGAIPGHLINAGLFTKSGNSNIDFRLPFTNTGTLALQTGTLNLLGAGSLGGVINIGNAGALKFSREYSFAPAVQLIGNGRVEVNGATIAIPSGYNVTGLLTLNGGKTTFNNPLTLSNLNFLHGELLGSGTVTITGTLTWTTGTMSGSGKTVSTGNLVMRNGGGFTQRFLAQRQLENVGVATLQEGYLNIFDSGIFVNQAGASFLDQSNTTGGIYLYGQSTGQLLNVGNFTKSGNSTIAFTLPFTNTGTLSLQTGTLSLDSSVDNLGTINLASSAILDINNAFTNQASGRISGSGTLDRRNATSFTNNGVIDPSVVVLAP